MKKRFAALACSLLLILQLAAPPVKAAGPICFTAAGIDILPLEDATMPFWYNGYLYVAAAIFTDQVNKALKVAYLPYTEDGICILYNGGRSLQFERGRGYAVDTSGVTYSPGSMERGGVTFVPISVVAAFFGFDCSYITLGNNSISGGNYSALVWMRRPEMTASLGLSDRDFANAASYQIASRYNQYIAAQSGEAIPPAGEDPLEEAEGKDIYLCLRAGEDASALMDALNVYRAKAAFFCSADFLESRGDLLRRMVAEGQAIGLLADAGDGDIPGQLEAGNRALARATLGKTRLVLLENGSEADRQAVREAGFCCLTPSVNRSGYELRSEESAETLLRRIAAQRKDDVTVWLDGEANTGGLRTFLSIAAETDNRCLALTETTP